MRRGYRHREVSFAYEDGHLVRTVVAEDGRSYTHRCGLATFEKVAWALDNHPRDEGFGVQDMAAALDLPHTQVDVTIAFLDERSIVDRRWRRAYVASTGVHLDAMVEWHALRAQAGGIEQPACDDVAVDGA